MESVFSDNSSKSKKLILIQNNMFKLAVFFDQFCKENNLKYAICGGTLLGAVRHKDFIPWDDDFDVIMPRDEFNKFLKLWKNTDTIGLVKNGDGNYYKVATPAKLHIKNTLVIESGEIENGIPEQYLSNGIFIDIFPIDEYPDNYFGILINKIYGVLCIKKSLSRFPMRNVPLLNRLLIRLFKFVPKIFFSTCNSYIIRILNSKNKNKNKEIKIGYGYETAVNNLWVDSRDIFPFIKEYVIRGYLFYGPNNVDVYLRSRFGNYTELPSINQRKGHIRKLFIDGIEVQ